MEVSSYKNEIVEYLAELVFEKFNKEEVRKKIRTILESKGLDYPILITSDGTTLEVLVGDLTFYVREAKSENKI